MSLLNTASPWSSSDTKKRIPSIGKRRTQRAREKKDDDDDSDADISESMQSTISQNAERGKTVYDMLNKITSSDAGDDLADFKPVAPPSLAQMKEGFDSSSESSTELNTAVPNSVPYDTGFEHLSSYAKSYEAGGILGKPYYANKGSANSGDPVMQKLNHITHILEELQMEKTSNITEELILYTFLGVFVIFVVDSFARVGKYHR